jgi:hypothetical protein
MTSLTKNRGVAPSPLLFTFSFYPFPFALRFFPLRLLCYQPL